MDRQRIGRRFGVANVFVVLRVSSDEVSEQLLSVGQHMRESYRSSSLQMEASQLHVTLVGIHCAPSAVQRVCDAMRKFNVDEREDRSDERSDEHRNNDNNDDNVNNVKNEQRKKNESLVETTLSCFGDNDENASRFDDNDKNLSSSGDKDKNLFSSGYNDKNMSSSGYNDKNLSRFDDYTRKIFHARDIVFKGLGAWVTAGGKWVLFAELERSDELWVKQLAEAVSKHLIQQLGADAEGYFDDGSAWIDVVDRNIHQPHVTLVVIDPEDDKELIKELEAKSRTLYYAHELQVLWRHHGWRGVHEELFLHKCGIRDEMAIRNADTREEALKKSGKGSDKTTSSKKKNKKLSSREKGQQEGRRERVLESMKEDNSFGRRVHLFKNERKHYKGFVFGTERCDAVYLEMGFQVLMRKELGPYVPKEATEGDIISEK